MSNKRFASWMLTFAIATALIGCRKKESSPSPSTAKDIKTATGIEMVLIPAGDFTMGDNAGDDDEKPAHHVKVGPFYMDKYEVTQKSYQALLGKNPSKFLAETNPVERVSWRSAIQYCNLRSAKEGLRPCYNLDTQECDFGADGYRLPTEAEWEYAARAGSTTPWFFGSSAGGLSTSGWFKANSGQTTHPVGQKKPNSWGLYDMYGNVAEWCNDRYGEKQYSAVAADDPRGPTAGDDRVVRGGSFRHGEDRCRSAARASESPGFADACFGSEAYGFRCVRKAPRP